MDNYAFINGIVRDVVLKFLGKEILSKEDCFLLPCESKNPPTFCMAQLTKYDVMIGDKKVGGAAQRRTKEGFLHQGSLSLALPDLNFLNQVLKDSALLSAMQLTTYPLLFDNQCTIAAARRTLAGLFKDHCLVKRQCCSN
jgi:lipoate-protein ligase A